MFAYCLNNAVDFFDDGGRKPKSYLDTVDDEDIGGIFPGFGDGQSSSQDTPYNCWQAAEQGTRDSLGSVQAAKDRAFSTPFGYRYVDAYDPTNSIIAESKYGYQGHSSFIASEIEKDVWLRDNHIVDTIEWHFFYSVRSNTIGPSGPLYLALEDANITIIIHGAR